MLPEKRQQVLTSQFEREADAARSLAHAHRDQRDQLASRILFGLVALNGATLITLLNSASALPGLNHKELLLSVGIFAAGVFCAGRAAVSELTHRIELAGVASARATTYHRAIALSKAEPGSKQFDQLESVFGEIDELTSEVFKTRDTATNLQSASACCWIAGLTFTAMADLVAKLPAWWPF